jgi:hypothetical protein
MAAMAFSVRVAPGVRDGVTSRVASCRGAAVTVARAKVVQFGSVR